MKKLITFILLSAASSAFAASPYLGANIGYLVDNEDAYFTTRIGSVVAQANGLTHSAELELGYTTSTDYGFELELVPVMANYRITTNRDSSKVEYFGGGGLGVSRVKLNGWGADDATWAFAVQAFGGVEYKATPTVSLTLGLRYLWIGRAHLFNVKEDVGDDLSVEAGIRYRF